VQRKSKKREKNKIPFDDDDDDDITSLITFLLRVSEIHGSNLDWVTSRLLADVLTCS